MKDLRPIRGKFHINRLVEEGEHERQDFKYLISDARKIARSISAFANNAGGRLLIGVKDNGTIAGVRNEEDIYVIEQAAELYCRPAMTLSFKAYTAGDDGAVVIIAEIPRADKRPVRASEPDGAWHAYYRVADENILAHPAMVHAWRSASRSRPAMLAWSHAEQTLLDAISSGLTPTPEEFQVMARLSTAAARDIIARLHAMDIIRFTFMDDRRFHITAHTD